MKLKKSLLALSSCAIITSNGIQARMLNSNHFPKDLLFNSKPISPACFDLLSESPNLKQINLKKCNQPTNEKHTVNEILAKKGYYGFDIETEEPQFRPPYQYYRAFTTPSGAYLIEALISGGGSGIFSSAYLVKRVDTNILAMQLLTGGDRCNGGITDISSNDKELTISVNVTPYVINELAKTFPIKNVPKSMDDCAACCAGIATYSVGLDGAMRLKKVDITTKE